MVFLLNPDSGVVTEGFLQGAFARGVEVYPVADEAADPRPRAEDLIDTFARPFLVYFLDGLPAEDWSRWLASIRRDEGIPLGAVSMGAPLDWAAETARTLMLTGSLRQRQAQLLRFVASDPSAGRRQAVRMRCPAGSTAWVPEGGMTRKASLLDLSVHHLSLRLEGPSPDWVPGTLVPGLRLVLPGFPFTVDACVEASRDDLWILSFAPSSEVSGLVYQHHQALMAETLESTVRRRLFFRS